MSVVGALVPHPSHLCGAWLEVPKVLLAQARLFIYLDRVSWKWRGFGGVRGEGLKDSFCGFASAAVWRGIEVKGVIWAEEGTKFAASFESLQKVLVKIKNKRQRY